MNERAGNRETGSRIAILGAGNMGTALAHLLANNEHSVAVWDHFPAVVEEIQSTGKNSRYLPGVSLPKNLRAHSDPIECAKGAGLIVIAVPSPFVRSILDLIKENLEPEAVVLNAAKGIDRETRNPIFHTIQELLPKHRHCLLAGPAIANEFARREPTQVLVASSDSDAATFVSALLANDFFQTAVTDDVIGAALGGILKNIYALLFGFVDTKISSGRNYEGALITKSIAEMASLGIALGARRETFYGLAGLGDLVTTSLSRDSHNRHCGQLLGQGKTLSEVEAEMKMLPEGVRTIEATNAWAMEERVQMPIADMVQKIVSGKPVGLRELMDSLA